MRSHPPRVNPLWQGREVLHSAFFCRYSLLLRIFPLHYVPRSRLCLPIMAEESSLTETQPSQGLSWCTPALSTPGLALADGTPNGTTNPLRRWHT